MFMSECLLGLTRSINYFQAHFTLCTHYPAKLQPQWTLTSQMFFSTSRLLYILVPLVFSQIFKGTASFHPLSLSLNFTYSGRPSLSTLARAAPILVFPHSHCPLPHISYYLLFSLSIVY